MEAWRLDADRIFRDQERAERLFAWLKKAGVLHIATNRGTDFTCLVGSRPDGMYPVLSILPFYTNGEY